MDLASAIPKVRETVVAVFRYRQTRPQTVNKKRKVRPAEFKVGWGSGFAVVADRYVVTAYHVVHDGPARNPDDRFLVFTVPGNGDSAHHFPVKGFPVERPDCDLTVMEIGPCATPGVRLPALPVSFADPGDGARVVTVGFPAPEIVGLNIDQAGVYRGGDFFLKSHANEGILSATYPLSALQVYEFNVGWHNGESGGPVVRLDDPMAAFTLMQQYRNVKGPHGVPPGPHRGCALASIRTELQQLGVVAV